MVSPHHFRTAGIIEPLESRIAPAVTLALNLASLNGSNGFTLRGETPTDDADRSVSGAGDVNGDGFADLLIGAVGISPSGFPAGASYVVFGKAGGFVDTFDLSSLNGTNGFKMRGEAQGDRFGYSVSAAGDVNGDGFDDVVIGADGVDAKGLYAVGASYVIFGKAAGFPAALDLSTLDGTNGFKMVGEAQGDRLGLSVSAAGDVNADGFGDLILKANSGDYVVFGKAGSFPPVFDLSTLNGSNGFKLVGVSPSFGSSVSGAGDVNGDGFADMIIGAPLRTESGFSAEISYVVFGNEGGFASRIDLSNLDGSNGFRLRGEKILEPNFGIGGGGGGRNGSVSGSVSGAGDVNGDGFADLLIAADGIKSNGSSAAGESYVVFGKSGGFRATFDLTKLNGRNGFKLVGEAENIYSGTSVSAAGDFNGDGFADLLIGNDGDSPGDVSNSGASYVVFGKASVFQAKLKLAALNGKNGFKVLGEAEDDHSGISVSGAGDVNGDGFDDLLIGAEGVDPNGVSSRASYVVFGTAAIAASVGLSQSALSLTYIEPDGDRVTVSLSKGNIAREKITLELVPGGGALLSRLELTGKNQGARVKITAETGPPPVGFAAAGVGNVGIPDVGSVTLPDAGGPKKVNIKGNVQEVNVPAAAQLKVFKVFSLGAGPDLFPAIAPEFTGAGTIAKVVVKQNVSDYTFGVPGAVDQMIVGGTVSGSTLTFAKPLQQFRVGANVEASTFSFGRSVGTVLVGGSVSGTNIRAEQIAVMNIAGVLRASSLIAGATPGTDGIFGTGDDQFVGSGRPGVVARIARIILGGVEGSAAVAGDGFGIVAEEIGQLTIGASSVALVPGARNDLTPIPLLPSGSTDDVFAREVAPP